MSAEIDRQINKVAQAAWEEHFPEESVEAEVILSRPKTYNPNVEQDDITNITLPILPALINTLFTHLKIVTICLGAHAISQKLGLNPEVSMAVTFILAGGFPIAKRLAYNYFTRGYPQI